MTLIMWAELFMLVSAVVALAYTAARIDMWLIQRAARRCSEQQHLVELLKRK